MDQIFESHFGGGGSGNNGTEIDAYCSKCRADTSHVILESYGNDIRRVQCTVCNDIHAFKKPRGPEPEPAEPPPAAESRRKIEKLGWMAAITNTDRQNCVRYSPKTQLKLHQLVVHPSFGVGFVTEILGDLKAELTFRDDVKRILVHARGRLRRGAVR